MTQNLGKLETAPLREAWEHEANDFTPWLAQECNLVQLGERLGIELELVGVEQSVGDFQADIFRLISTQSIWCISKGCEASNL